MQILSRVWYLQEAKVLIAKASPSACMQTIITAAQPSANRLHLRSLFSSGRRYQVSANKQGFQLTTTSKVWWHYRRRTFTAAVIHAKITSVNNEITRIDLQARMALRYLIDTVIIPIIIGVFIIFSPLSLIVIITFLTTVIYLSWLAHRTNARLEASEMIYFVQKALEDLESAEIVPMSAATPGVIYEGKDFEKAWQEFYSTHQKS